MHLSDSAGHIQPVVPSTKKILISTAVCTYVSCVSYYIGTIFVAFMWISVAGAKRADTIVNFYYCADIMNRVVEYRITNMQIRPPHTKNS